MTESVELERAKERSVLCVECRVSFTESQDYKPYNLFMTTAGLYFIAKEKSKDCDNFELTEKDLNGCKFPFSSIEKLTFFN